MWSWAISCFAAKAPRLSEPRSNTQITFLQITEPRLERGEERVSASDILIDFNERNVYLTNGVSTADPMPVVRAIGAKAAAAIEPYQFLKPPNAQVYGMISMDDIKRVDFTFRRGGRAVSLVEV